MDKKMHFHLSGCARGVFILALISVLASPVFSEEPVSGSNEIPAYEDELTTLLNDFNALKEELIVARQDYRKLKNEASAILEEKASLETQLRDAKAKEQQLQSQVQQLNLSAAEKDKVIAGFRIKEQRTQAEAQQTIADLNQNSLKLSNQIKDSEARIAALQQEKIALESQIKDAKIKEQELQPRLQQLTASSAEKDKAIAELNQAKQQLQNQLQQLGASSGDKDKAIAELKTKERDLQMRLEQSAATAADKDKAIAELKRIEQHLDGKIQKISADSSAKDKTINEMNQAKQQLQAQLQQAASTGTEKDKLIAELNQIKQQFLNQIKDNEAKLSALQQEKNTLEAQSKELNSRLQSALNRSQLQEAQLSQLKNETGVYDTQLMQLSQAIQDKDKIISDLEKGQHEQLKKLDEYSVKVRDYEAKLTQAQNDKVAQSNQFDELKSQQKFLQSQFQMLTTTIQDKDRFIGELTQTNQQLSARVKDAENKIVFLQSDKLSLESQLHEAQLREQDRMSKRDEMNAALMEKEKNIKELVSRVQNYQMKMAESEGTRQQVQDKNKMLFKDNKLLIKKIDVYGRRLAQVALLKDRLLKENAVLHYNLGVFYLQRQEYNDALVEFEKVLELNPNDAATHYNLGLIYAEYIGNKNKAILHFKRYLNLDPKDKDADKAKKYILTWETWQDEKIDPH
ncbi:MAG: tetratricopeptide repeat protein [Candidatus Omnitrophota bacterium]